MRTNSNGFHKTPLMRRIEKQYRIDIVALLASAWLSNQQVAALIDVDFTTVSKWRTKLAKAAKD